MLNGAQTYELANLRDSDLRGVEDDLETGLEDSNRSRSELGCDEDMKNEKENEKEEQKDVKDITKVESAADKPFAESELLTIQQEKPPLVETSDTKPIEEHIIIVYIRAYLKKFAGVPGKHAPAMTKPWEMCISSLLAFIGIFLVALTDEYYLLPSFYAGHSSKLGIKMLTGAYAATSVLIYEAYQSPLAQPRNVFGSYTICSFVGVSTRLVCDIIGLPRYVTGALAVAIAIFFMNITKTVHPPGGACALISVIGGAMIEAIGYGYVLTSMGAAFIMLSVAVIGNNLFPSRQYPLYWY